MTEMLVIGWFSLCAFLHCCFEGYFVFFHRSLAGRQDLFAQLWKEYGLSDSRYLVSDPFMLVWGPLSLAAVAAIVLRSPLRILLTTLVSMGHLYGVVLYYSTCYVEHAFTGRSHSRPEFLYFWVYYAGCNIPWAIVPSS
ncbi:3-beta-hydroxysteroid-Delta(8),Delta(7)-isomerase [Ceratocystis fimbriata CBS 114723]|uniref:3-beta-hydroxysteroid-Delta(8), Delta(7)-isomerase n=1 Tax=Ceratocystis fimbriata CBS 114723 TaxID=1035309 RepID=A0A2C5X6K7_9PEZI|nr:3-beta-hydroxysteroid-Delta(8),Delta(7)-isomerase [Ceratocystis fimbriata CBS 114723]